MWEKSTVSDRSENDRVNATEVLLRSTTAVNLPTALVSLGETSLKPVRRALSLVSRWSAALWAGPVKDSVQRGTRTAQTIRVFMLSSGTSSERTLGWGGGTSHTLERTPTPDTCQVHG